MNDTTTTQTKRPDVTTVIGRPTDRQLELIEELLKEHHATVPYVAANFTVYRGAATTEDGHLVGVRKDATICIFAVHRESASGDWCLTGFDPEVHTIVEGRLLGSVTDKWSRGQLTWTHR